jgi:hypothetical protein
MDTPAVNDERRTVTNRKSDAVRTLGQLQNEPIALRDVEWAACQNRPRKLVGIAPQPVRCVAWRSNDDCRRPFISCQMSETFSYCGRQLRLAEDNDRSRNSRRIDPAEARRLAFGRDRASEQDQQRQ